MCRGLKNAIIATLLGVLFVVSAVAKLLSIDFFEVYVFSFGLLGLSFSYLVARGVVVVELVLGAVLLLMGVSSLARWRYAPRCRQWRLVSAVVACLLLCFSLFLCYAALSGRSDSCQCMGRLLDFTPAQSLLKNAVLLLAALAMGKTRDGASASDVAVVSYPLSRRRLFGFLLGGVLLALSVSVFVVSVPDNWMFGAAREVYDEAFFDNAVGSDGVLADYCLDEGVHLVAFLTPGCPYCQLAKQKLDAIALRHHIESSFFCYIYPQTVSPAFFMGVTYGQRPLLLLLDGGDVVATYHYRNIDEDEIAACYKSHSHLL